MLWQSAASSAAAAAEPAREPSLLLKYASPDLPESEARRILDPLAGRLGKGFRVRWIPVPVESSPQDSTSAAKPVPDDNALRRIAAKVSRGVERMEAVETDAAERLLAEAEEDCRAYRFTEATLPFLVEIFLRRGILRLWEGKTGDAETLLSRVRALRPGFTPDPALYPPQFLSSWEASKRRPLPEAELLIESLPPGASIFIDGERRGSTPSRIRTKKTSTLRIRVSHPGYRDVETLGQWLPGDSEILRFSLPGDRIARLGELLAAFAGGKESGAGPLVGEISAAAGARRTAIVMLGKDETGGGLLVRLFAGGKGGADPVLLGETSLTAGGNDATRCAEWVAEKLAAGGWPREEPPEKPWYYSYWFWGIVLSAAGLAAALGGGGGGGGSSGSSGGAVAVTF
ncbi:MAG: hypothetical protein OHK0028_06280 [Deltaproteobacteria bacterium]